MIQVTRVWRSIIGLLLVGMITPPSFCWAAPRAWLISEDGEAIKLDLSQNAIVQTRQLPIGRLVLDDLGADASRGTLFVPNGRGPFEVAALDMKTLALKGILDFTVNLAPTGSPETVRFIFPQTDSDFFVRAWDETADGGTGAFVLATVDSTTLKTKARQVSSPALADKLMLDATGRQLYSIRTHPKPPRIDVFGMPSFTRTSTIDLEAFLNPTAFGRDIDDFGGGKVLLVENEKTRREDPNRYTLFVYDLTSGRTTPKIRTGMRGDGKLLPRTNRALFDEKIVAQSGPRNLLGRPTSPGVIHVYDTATGNELGIVRVSVEQAGIVLGANSTEDTVYYVSFGAANANPKLSVINLNAFSVVKEIPLPFLATRMVLFDE